MTLLDRSSTILQPLLGPHSLHKWPFPGRSPDRRSSTPTWTIRPAPWPKAAAPPRWERASRPGRHLIPLPARKNKSLVRSWRPVLPCSAHLCHRLRPSPPAPPRLLHMLQLRHHPAASTPTPRPLASPCWSSLSARVAASVWTGGRALVCLELPDVKLRSILQPEVSQNTDYVRTLKLKTDVSVWLWAYFIVCRSCQTSVS